jgi:hypothetical protein
MLFITAHVIHSAYFALWRQREDQPPIFFNFIN